MEDIQDRNKIIWEIDNDDRILDFCFPDGTSYWLAIRLSLKFTMVGNRTNEEGAIKSKRRSKYEFYKYILFCFFHSPFRKKERVDILSIANWEGNPQCPNRMTQFLDELPDLSKVQLLYSMKMSPFRNLKNTFSFDYFYYYALINSKLNRRKPTVQQIESVDNFIQFLIDKLYGWVTEDDIRKFKSDLLMIGTIVEAYCKRMRRYLEVVKPKLIVLSEGNNGDWMKGSLFKLANEMKIPTAEVQHGIFGIGMKYGTKLAEKENFQNQKTNYLLVFGKYHIDAVNAGGECIVYGNHQLEKSLQNLKPRSISNGKVRILFVCEGIPYTASNNGLVLNAAEALKQIEFPFELVIRLHQTEEPNKRYEDLEAFPDSRYSRGNTENIYQLLCDSDVIIGHISTVLFEALYFHTEPFVFEDDYTRFIIPEDLGLWFKNSDELKQLLNKFHPPKPIDEEVRKVFWAEGSTIDNFRKFWNTKILNN